MVKISQKGAFLSKRNDELEEFLSKFKTEREELRTIVRDKKYKIYLLTCKIKRIKSIIGYRKKHNITETNAMATEFRKKYGCPYRELTSEQRREYNREYSRKRRQKLKEQ